MTRVEDQMDSGGRRNDEMKRFPLSRTDKINMESGSAGMTTRDLPFAVAKSSSFNASDSARPIEHPLPINEVLAPPRPVEPI